jgi:hypothetical protein
VAALFGLTPGAVLHDDGDSILKRFNFAVISGIVGRLRDVFIETMTRRYEFNGASELDI